MHMYFVFFFGIYWCLKLMDNFIAQKLFCRFCHPLWIDTFETKVYIIQIYSFAFLLFRHGCAAFLFSTRYKLLRYSFIFIVELGVSWSGRLRSILSFLDRFETSRSIVASNLVKSILWFCRIFRWLNRCSHVIDDREL